MRSSRVFKNAEWVEFEKTRLGYRFEGYAMLSGKGIEIGAMDHPANVPDACDVFYVDALTPEGARKLFQELGDVPYVEPDYLCDVDKDDLSSLGPKQWDFAVLNHVIEHVANPLQVIKNVERLIKPGGFLVIAAPDKQYTYDRKRGLTSFEHLLEEYYEGVDHVTLAHYLDHLEHVNPKALELPEPERQQKIQHVIDRREHAHVWDSASFRDFLVRGFEVLELKMKPVFERFGETTEIEYFGIWELEPL